MKKGKKTVTKGSEHEGGSPLWSGGAVDQLDAADGA
jgi:hypothetical protein